VILIDSLLEPLNTTVTVSPGSAVPDNIGNRVWNPPMLTPVITAARFSTTGAARTGVGGGSFGSGAGAGGGVDAVVVGSLVGVGVGFGESVGVGVVAEVGVEEGSAVGVGSPSSLT
jgi:hypothetical protein